MPTGSRTRTRGFTILELMIVVAIILILAGVAAGRYQVSLRYARESTLLHNLQVMRKAIDAYTVDKLAAPQSLQDLVSAGYLYAVPEDPITRQKDWVPVFEQVVISPEQIGTGITNVHSASTQPSLKDGTPYNTW